MDKGFFQSREFLVAAAVAGLLLTAAVAVALAVDDASISLRRSGCSEPDLVGTTLDPDRSELPAKRAEGQAIRVVSYTLDASSLRAGSLDVCGAVGDITISPSPDANVRISFTITNHHDRTTASVDAAKVAARFTDDAGALNVGAWLVRGSVAEQGFFGGQYTTSVDIEIEVPAGGPWRVVVDNDVGDVTLAGLQVARLVMHVDVGDIEVAGASVNGEIDASTDVGDIVIRTNSVATGIHQLRTDVGDIDLHVPLSNDVGYDVDAATDVGRIRVEIGETEHYEERDGHGPNEAVTARSQDFAAKAIRVTIEATTDVGSIDIIAN